MTPTRTAHCAAHARHIGTCGACQRERIAAERRQLNEALSLAAHEGEAPSVTSVVPSPSGGLPSRPGALAGAPAAASSG